MDLPEVFRGVEGVWAAWAVSLAVLVRGLTRARPAARRPALLALARCDRGASYSLAYVFVVPIYLLFLCVVVETSMLLVAKVGTMYAAHAGVRSAVVWQSASHKDGPDVRGARIRQSVRTAMAPFVSNRRSDIAPTDFRSLGDVVPTNNWLYPNQLSGLRNGTSTELPDLDGVFVETAEFTAVYKLYERGSAGQNPAANRSYSRTEAPLAVMATKYANASFRTTLKVNDVSVDELPARPWPAGEPVTVAVTYRAPFYIPGARKFLTRGGLPWIEITSKATLPNETPVSADGTLGIKYQSR